MKEDIPSELIDAHVEKAKCELNIQDDEMEQQVPKKDNKDNKEEVNSKEEANNKEEGDEKTKEDITKKEETSNGLSYFF